MRRNTELEFQRNASDTRSSLGTARLHNVTVVPLARVASWEQPRHGGIL
jgi:hypothetical protein